MGVGPYQLRTVLLAVVAAVAIALGVIPYLTEALRYFELSTVDTRFSIRGAEDPPSDIVVVGVDAKSFDADDRWPFAHDRHAKVVNRLKKDGAKVIALDIQFSESSEKEAHTQALLDAVFYAGNVVVSTTEFDDFGNGHVFDYNVPDPVFDSKKRGAVNDFLRRDLRIEPAWGNFPTDPGGSLRRIEYGAGEMKSFAIATAEKAEKKKISRSDLGGDTAWIDYYGPPRTIKHISYGDVRDGRTKPGTFRNKIVVVGTTAPVLQDVHPTSFADEGEMAGPEIQAQAVGTALDGFPLQDLPTGLGVLLIAFMGLVAPAASLRFRALPAFGIALVVGTLYVVATQLLFNEGTIVPFVYVMVTLVVSAVGALAVHYLTEAFERQRTREAFSRFVPESVVGEVLEQADGARLGGVGREATVMFSDMRGFTSFAESLEPDQVIAILNRYLTAMVDEAIIPAGGTLVDYMGDGIMAVFGAPIPMDDHADRALAASRAKLRELHKFNEWLRNEMGFDKSFQMGIGLNSGRVMSGNVGSEQRLAYTAIGDTTNTAARLEAMTKGTPHMLFMADSTKELLSEEPEDLLFVDEFEVRGRAQRVKIWSVAESAKLAEEDQAFKSVGAPAPAASGGLKPARRR